MNHQNFRYGTDGKWGVSDQQIEIELTATLSSYRFDPLDRRPDFAEKLLNSDTATKDEKAPGSILMHALVSSLQ